MIKERVAPSRRARLPIWRRLGWRLTVAVLLLTAVGILASGLLQYRAQERFLRDSLGGLLLNIARTGALLVDGDVHEQVVRAGRNDTAEYLALQDRLLLIQETNQLGDAVYTLSHIEGDTARYGVISNGLAPVGQAYRLAPETRPVLRRVLTEGQAGFTGIYASDDGRWITAFAPIRNRTELTVGALEVDFRADVYLAQLQAVRRRLWVHSLVAALLAIGAGVFISRQVTRPVGQLVVAAQRVVEGDLASPVRVDARDEIGLLGNVFHLMVDRLHASHRSLVDVLVRALESRDGESGSLARLARASVALGAELELDAAQ
ncbi:MAG TPA: HAMP domain-containing protein, partial [Methylomirabilota bacterium]|nr:HAMP domain-containing protein [Methylomirabilota bacterium]